MTALHPVGPGSIVIGVTWAAVPPLLPSEGPMTSDNTGGGVSRNVILSVLLTLFVTVIGGLLVEYLKPGQSYTNPTAVQAAGAAPVQGPPPLPTIPPLPQAPTPQAPAPPPQSALIQNLLVKKWYAVESPTLFGDTQAEFTPYGKVVRTYYRQLVGNSVTSHPYQIAADGTLSSDAATNLQLVHVSNDELVLSWNGTVVRYKRGWHWWEITLLSVGGVLLLVILGVLGGGDKK